MTAEIFDSDDKSYFAWLSAHPRGFVVNTTRGRSPKYMVLHRASCYSIAQPNPRAEPGGFMERDYIKVCADDIRSLRVWARQNGRTDGSFSSECRLCGPVQE